MAKYTLELTIKYATELTLSELDEETKDKLESSEDFNDEAYDVFHDSEYVAQGVVMNNDALYNADTFSLTVKDEDDEWVDLIAPHAERWSPDSWFRTLPIIWDERK